MSETVYADISLREPSTPAMMMDAIYLMVKILIL